MTVDPSAPASEPPGTYSPLLQLVLARVREFYREPEALFWVYGFPILMAVALGIAFRNRPVEKIRVDVQQGLEARVPTGTGGAEGQPLRQILAADPRILVEGHSAEQCRQRLRTAKTDLALLGTAPPSAGTESSAYEYWFDPTRPESVLARTEVDNLLLRAREPASAPTVAEHPLEEPGGRYIDFLIPGLLGMNLMGGGLWGVGFVTVDMRVRKLLKRFLATPMKKTDFLLGIMISRLLFTIPEILILLVFAYVFFSVGVKGSLGSLLVLIVLGAACFMGIGLLVACRARTNEAVSGLMNLVMLPMYILSGIFFPSERFPALVQPLIKALPLTALNDALRAVMLDGISLAGLGLEIAILAAWGVISFVLALRWFRWY